MINELPDEMIESANHPHRKVVHFRYILPAIAAVFVAVISLHLYHNYRDDIPEIIVESSVSEFVTATDTSTHFEESEVKVTTSTEASSIYNSTTFSESKTNDLLTNSSVSSSEISSAPSLRSTSTTTSTTSTTSGTTTTQSYTSSYTTTAAETDTTPATLPAGWTYIPYAIEKQRTTEYDICAGVGNGGQPAITTADQPNNSIETTTQPVPAGTGDATFFYEDCLRITLTYPCKDADILSLKFENGMLQVSIVVLIDSEPIENDETTRFLLTLPDNILYNLYYQYAEIVKTDDETEYVNLIAKGPQFIAKT